MSKHYDMFTIQQYLAGDLDSEKSYELERNALQDPLLQDAIDGFENSKAISNQEISILQQRLHNRIAHQQEKRNHFFFGRQRLAIASIGGVLFILACILFWMINFPLKKEVSTASKEVSVSTLSAVHANLKSGDLEPTIGWKDYNHYLTINNPEGGNKEEIEISFKIINERPTSIIVVAPSDANAAKEIIKLLESGPSWKGSEGVIVIQY